MSPSIDRRPAMDAAVAVALLGILVYSVVVLVRPLAGMLVVAAVASVYVPWSRRATDRVPFVLAGWVVAGLGLLASDWTSPLVSLLLGAGTYAALLLYDDRTDHADRGEEPTD